MDQKIKNFDRSIEQMMNEHQVAPPFGMWNRISSELEAMPVPVAAAAPVVTSLIPKRAIAGIIASALILGASIMTGYMVNSSLSKSNVAGVTKAVSTPVVIATPPVTNNNIVEPVASVKHETAPVVAKTKVNHIAATPVEATLQAAQQVNPGATQPVAANNGVSASNNSSLVINNSNTDVPTPIEPVAQQVADNQTYYFPPIDVNTTEKAKTTETPVAKSHAKIAAAPAASDDDKSSNSGDRKFRFRNHRRAGWNWGKINTTK